MKKWFVRFVASVLFFQVPGYSVMRGDDLAAHPPCDACIEVDFKTCSGVFGAYPGLGSTLACAGGCTYHPVTPTQSEPYWTCNSIGNTEFTILELENWLIDIVPSANFPWWPQTGHQAFSSPPVVCKVTENCEGCLWDAQQQIMKCNKNPVVYSIPVYTLCVDANFDLIECDNDPH